MLTTLHATAGEKKQPRVPPTLFQILGPAGLSDLPPPLPVGLPECPGEAAGATVPVSGCRKPSAVALAFLISQHCRSDSQVAPPEVWDPPSVQSSLAQCPLTKSRATPAVQDMKATHLRLNQAEKTIWKEAGGGCPKKEKLKKKKKERTKQNHFNCYSPSCWVSVSQMHASGLLPEDVSGWAVMQTARTHLRHHRLPSEHSPKLWSRHESKPCPVHYQSSNQASRDFSVRSTVLQYSGFTAVETSVWKLLNNHL